MDKFEYGLLNDFIGENWARFIAFCEERGVDESGAESLSSKLEKQQQS